jgi:hypothetical protein
MNRSKQEDRHERFTRGDALAAQVSLLLPQPALLKGTEGWLRDAAISNRAGQSQYPFDDKQPAIR